MRKQWWLCLGLAVAAPLVARADLVTSSIVDVLVDGGNTYTWQKVALPGLVCGNGSPYKFFTHTSTTGSKNLLFLFEGGGACWDYDTCSGRAGIIGAANPNGIPDDYMTQFTAKYVSPLVNGTDPGLVLIMRQREQLVTEGWNVIYLPYCTGDVHVGNHTATYPDTTGQQPPLVWHHAGYTNTQAAIQYARTQWPHLQKLLVTGFSAGGTASLATYYFVRRGLNPARGYLLNDSGPIYLAGSAGDHSRPMHNKIRQAWALDAVFNQFPASFDRDNLGTIHRMLATEFPQDQLAYTAFTRDYNYSRFSYERFLTPHDEESIHHYWKEDQDRLVTELKLYNNYSYFIPHYRQINASHCSTIITFDGSHACPHMEKKHSWSEYLTEPWQSFKCYGEDTSMSTFLERFIDDDQRLRLVEPPNGYNQEDPGLRLISPLINSALNG